MDEQAGDVVEHSRHGCMECHAHQPYTVEHFANGNTGWRCVGCGHILNLIPGQYTSPLQVLTDSSH
jgi:hypothetical protein